MVDSQHESLLRAVRHCQESLDYYTEHRNDAKLLNYLDRLCKLPIKVIHLEQTGVGRTVNGLRKLGGEVGDSAKTLVVKWKDMVVGEQEEQEEEDDEDDEEDDEEDGYQSGEEGSNDTDDKDSRDNKTKNDNSSHRKSDNRTEDKVRKSKHSKGEESGSSRKHHKENGHSKHKSHKRRNDYSSSEEESPKKRHKSEHKRRIESDSENESKSKDKKHKHKSSKKLRDSSSDFEEPRKSSKETHKEKERDKHRKKEEAKKQEKKIKDRDKEREREREKEKKRDSEKKSKSSKSKHSNGALITNGIDSGSGASFAEALGMCGPSSSGAKPPKKKSEKERDKKEKEKERIPVKLDDPIPKALKEPALDPVDINISSLLPTITPNYRPLGVPPVELQPKKPYNEFEALSSIISSKNQRTKVYSGNKMGGGKVPSLFELCSRVLQDHIDALEYTGGVPYQILKPILEKSNPNQLYMMEHHNPYLVEDTDELWKLHCQKEFRNKRREELETWREMYLRCLDERDAKLKALTANIKQSQDKSLPVRMTKLAYVDAVAKPPRNIARKQAKNGTATVDRKPTAAKLVSLATAGEAGKVSVPNPAGRATERSSSHAVKPKKAPLMLKSISSFKNRFKR